MTPSAFRTGRWLVAAVVSSSIPTLALPAWANVPEFEEALRGTAREEYFEACPEASTTGAPCQGKVCGQNIALDAGGNPVLRTITIDGDVYNLHSPDEDPSLAVADFLNATCNDTFALSGGHFALQTTSIMSIASSATTVRRQSYIGAGALLELGSDNTAGVVPFNFTQDLSSAQFIAVGGGAVLLGTTRRQSVRFRDDPGLGPEGRRR